MDSVLLELPLSAERNTKPISISAEQKLLLLQKLQGVLDLRRLFEILMAETCKQIDVSYLVWELDSTSFVIKRGKTTPFIQTFSLKLGSLSLGLLQYHTPYKLDDDEITVLKTYHQLFTGPLSTAIEYRRVKNLAMKDHLSGLGNRTSFDNDIIHAIAVSQREDIGLALLMFDLDNFKQVNDEYGHLDGDKVICRFAHIINKTVRASDRCFRLGGDEFCIILQPASLKSAHRVSQEISKAVQEDGFLSQLNIDTSFGFSMHKIGDNKTSLFERADRRLYKNKREK